MWILALANAALALQAADQPPKPLRYGEWFMDMYPERAWRLRIEGDTYYVATVGTDGRATGCEIEKSSGDESLDKATCNAVRNRARFKPATANGVPVAGVFHGKAAWRAPSE